MSGALKDIKLNNIKGLLIFLVVFGHFISIYKYNFYDLYLVIYAFHMPLFVFVSGYFAKRANFIKVASLLLIFLIFQTIYTVSSSLLIDHSIELEYLTPYFQLWYIFSLALWYLVAIILKKIKNLNQYKIPILLLALFIGVFVRFFSLDNLSIPLPTNLTDYTLSYMRTLSFTFFFLAGFFVDGELMKKFSSIVKNKILVFAASISAVLIFIELANKHNLEMIFRGVFGVTDFSPSSTPALYQILICYGVSIFMGLLVLNLVSDKKSILTKWGEYSLQIFLFHAFAVQLLKHYQASLLNLSSISLLVILAGISVVIIEVVSSKIFIKYTYYLCKPLDAIGAVIKSYERRSVSATE